MRECNFTPSIVNRVKGLCEGDKAMVKRVESQEKRRENRVDQRGRQTDTVSTHLKLYFVSQINDAINIL